MNEMYVEWLVDRKMTGKGKAARALGIFLIVVAVLLYLMTASSIALLLIVVFGIATWFLFRYTKVEYEYSYVDKEISVDRIANKTSRKRVAVYDLGKAEIIAPEKSAHLDGFRHRQYKKVDYTSNMQQPENPIYIMYYNTGEQVYFELNDEFANALYRAAPNKVFLN
ncbi:MAG: DUF6106 family protein [Lachnospiraceae bacterium]|nr:DUF6106 family protein [Lachnospiraceae bacterium]